MALEELAASLTNLAAIKKINSGDYTPPTIIAGLIVEKDNGYSPNLGNHVLTPRNDGSYIDMGTATTSDIVMYDAAGSVDWTVTKVNIDAAATHMVGGFVWDTVDDKIYVCASTTSNLYFASINHTTGAVTNIQTIAITNLAVANATSVIAHGMSRIANGSGDFTVGSEESGGGSPVCNSITFDATGSVTEAESQKDGRLVYRTAGGHDIGVFDDIVSSQSSLVTEGKDSTTLHVDDETSGISIGNACVLVQIGDWVSFRGIGISTTWGARYFDRVSMDAYIDSLINVYTGAMQ